MNDTATWRLGVRNRGPNAALPRVVIDVPRTVSLRTSSATAGASCDAGTCYWFAPIPPGGDATISITAEVLYDLGGGVSWQASIFGQSLLPPHTDDRAELVTPLGP